MFELTASDLDERINGFDIPQLDMTIPSITFFGYLSFPAKRTLSEHLDMSLEMSCLVVVFLHVCKIFFIVQYQAI